MSASDQGISWGMWCVILCGLAAVLQLFRGNDPPPAFVPDRSSFEHRYAQERLRQEGLSRSDAQTAADAIIKFQRAQEARR